MTQRNKPKRYHTVHDVLSETRKKGACMEWRGALNKDGYAACGVGGIFKSCALHREVFALLHGHRPEVVMHTCDNRKCLNPAHLVAGTAALNLQDKLNKGRQAKGEGNGNAKLKASDVRTVRDMPRAGVQWKEIAALYAIATVTVWRISSGKNWGHHAHR